MADEIDTLTSFPAPFCALVIGASGGVGAALTARLLTEAKVVEAHALARRPLEIKHPKLRCGFVDLMREETLAALAQRSFAAPVRLIIVATGLLHDGEGMRPEKRLADLDPARLARSFAINATGPALAFKHLAPLLPRDGKAVLAALSARVGSISDNRLGGWYGYRAAKAALNQLIRTSAIEIGARRREALCVGLHPGTVDTGLSKPFQTGVAADRLFSPAFAAARLLAVLDGLVPADSGGVFAWDGSRVPD